MILNGDRVQKWSCEVVGSQQFLQAIQVWVGEDQVFLIAHLTFHSQSPILPVGRRPPCSGTFARLWSHTCLCPSDGRRCWSCSSKVPKCFFQAVLVIRPNFYSNRHTQGGCATLAILPQMYFKRCHEGPWSEKTVLDSWCCLTLGWNSNLAPFTMQCPERYRCDSLRSFADWTWTSPVCIPSAIPCAKVPCVVPLWSFPCLWRVQLGEVLSPYLTCPMRTATTWSPDGILVPWSGGYRSDAGENDDVSRNPFLWTLKLCYKIVDLWCIQGMQKKRINTDMRI